MESAARSTPGALTCSKNRLPRSAGMNPSARRQTSRNRDSALSRLNSITTGTAIAAAVATAGFGALAAINYSGT